MFISVPEGLPPYKLKGCSFSELLKYVWGLFKISNFTDWIGCNLNSWKEMELFFEPRVGSQYDEGLNGYKTFVLGAYHICTIDCAFKDVCLSAPRNMDDGCPVYKGKDDYYRLSNSDTIEIDSFLEGFPYPAYSDFTKIILNRKDYLYPEEKNEFWNHVIFHNFLQVFRKDGSPLDFIRDRQLLVDSIGPLKELLETYKPELLYVWHEAVAEVLKTERDRLPGLEYVQELDNPILTVHIFSYMPDWAGLSLKQREDNKYSPILSAISEKKKYGSEKFYKLLIKSIQCLRKGQELDMNSSKFLSGIEDVLRPVVWDNHFIDYIEGTRVLEPLSKIMDQHFDNKAALLEKVMKSAFSEGITVSSSQLIMKSIPMHYHREYRGETYDYHLDHQLWYAIIYQLMVRLEVIADGGKFYLNESCFIKFIGLDPDQWRQNNKRQIKNSKSIGYLKKNAVSFLKLMEDL